MLEVILLTVEASNCMHTLNERTNQPYEFDVTFKKLSEYDQEIPKSHTADQSIAP